MLAVEVLFGRRQASRVNIRPEGHFAIKAKKRNVIPKTRVTKARMHRHPHHVIVLVWKEFLCVLSVPLTKAHLELATRSCKSESRHAMGHRKHVLLVDQRSAALEEVNFVLVLQDCRLPRPFSKVGLFEEGKLYKMID